jgi:hypothetical protein
MSMVGFCIRFNGYVIVLECSHGGHCSTTCSYVFSAFAGLHTSSASVA